MRRPVLALIIILLLPLVLAVNPPSLESQQFSGTVKWNAPTVYTEVVAQVSTNQYRSALKDLSCNAVTCTATYGQAQDNILLVQGSTGATVSFYLGQQLVRTTTYTADTVMVIDLDLTVPVANVSNTTDSTMNGSSTTDQTNTTGCQEEWICGNWAECVNGTKKRPCSDANKCDANVLNINETQQCGQNVSKVVVTCEYNWQCTTWSDCLNNVQTRSCQRTDDCDAKFTAGTATSLIVKPQPEQQKSCVSAPASEPIVAASCTDSIKNQNEVEVDCGGVCPVCAEKATPWYYYALPAGIILVLIIIGIAAVYVLRERAAITLSPALIQQLQSYFQRNMQRGLSKEQVIDNLIKGGWEKKVVKKFLKHSKL